MPSNKMPTPVKRKTSTKYWIRKKVPLALRPLVGKTEIWASLGTTDQRRALAKLGAVNAAIETEWARLRAGGKAAAKEAEPPPSELTHQDLYALRGAAHVRFRDAHIADPPKPGFGSLRILAHDGLDREIVDFLESEGVAAIEENVERFRTLYSAARNAGYADVMRAAKGDYSASPELAKVPPRTTPKLDMIKAFEEYAAKGGLKGGSLGPTAKRWRPKIRAFAKWLGHRDLARVTTADGYRWVDHLIEEGYARKSIRDVWVAALSATAGFMVERRKLPQNPFRGIKVREAVDEEAGAEVVPPRQKGFSRSEATAILTATLSTPSHLISTEMRAARRWLPWLCAYSGARVNELTSLYPQDVSKDSASGIWCMVIKPSLEKTAQWRVVPIHSHVIAQGFLAYVDARRKLDKPLFYDPARSRGGKPGNPQFKKVAERIAEWLHGLGIVPSGVKPNHSWRHLFKSVARDVGMDREVEGFITGHRPKDSNAGNDYGDRWIKTMAAEIEKYPRFKIAALTKQPTPHKRVRRTPAQIAAAQISKVAAGTGRP